MIRQVVISLGAATPFRLFKSTTLRKGGESRVRKSTYWRQARQRTAARDPGAGRAASPGPAAGRGGQGIAAGRTRRTAAAAGRPPGGAAARGPGAMTSLRCPARETRRVSAPPPDQGGGVQAR